MTTLVRDTDGHKISVSNKDEAKIARLKELGFREEDSAAPSALPPEKTQPATPSEPATETASGADSSATTPPAGEDYAAKTTDELRTLATFRNLAVNDRTSRAKLISMLQDSEPK